MLFFFLVFAFVLSRCLSDKNAQINNIYEKSATHLSLSRKTMSYMMRVCHLIWLPQS